MTLKLKQIKIQQDIKIQGFYSKRILAQKLKKLNYEKNSFV